MSDHDPYGEPTRVDTPVSDPTMAMPAATGAPPPPVPPATGEPPAEPPDRRPWVIAGLVLAILLLGLVLFLLSDDDDDTSTSASTTTTSSTTTSSTTTTTAPPTTTTTAPTTTTTATATTVDPARCVSSAPDDPGTTAQVVYDAYVLDDRSCAGNLMTADAMDQLFGIPGRGGGWSFMGCEDVEDPDPQTWCSYRFEGGSTTFRMAYGEAEGWTVYDVFQTAD
jgi:hypothetical protein